MRFCDFFTFRLAKNCDGFVSVSKFFCQRRGGGGSRRRFVDERSGKILGDIFNIALCLVNYTTVWEERLRICIPLTRALTSDYTERDRICIRKLYTKMLRFICGLILE